MGTVSSANLYRSVPWRRSIEKRAANRPRIDVLDFRVESLEARRLLTTILDLDPGTAAPDTFTFSDGDGDVIVLRLEGTAGIAEITSDDSVIGNGGNLDDGEAIQSIAITGASSDFVLSFAVDTTIAATADGNVMMGAIHADSIIRGIYTISDASGISDFELTSFTGVAFSDGGGISVDRISNAGGTAIELSQTLQAGRVINVRSQMSGNVLMQSGAFGGTFNVRGNVAGDFWGIRGPVSSSGIISVNGDVDADINIGGNFDGIATISGVVGGSWFVDGNVSAKAHLQANRWSFVDITGDLAGTMTSRFDDLIINVGGSIKSTARVSSADVLELDVAGSVLAGATIAAQEVNNANVVGNFDGVFNISAGNLGLIVGGNMRGARISSSDSAVIDVLGSVADSQIAAQHTAIVDAAAGMRDSKLFASSGSALFVGGSLVRSTLTGGQGAQTTVEGDIKWSSFESDLGNLSLHFTGDLVESHGTSGASGAFIVTDGSVVSSSLHSQQNIVSVTAGGTVKGSNFVSASDEVVLQVDGDLIDTNVESREMADVDVLGSVSRSRIHSANGIAMVIVGLDLTHSQVSSAGQDVDLEVQRNMRRSQVFANAGAAFVTVFDDTVDTTIMSDSGNVIVTGGLIFRTTISAGASNLNVSTSDDIRDSHLMSLGGASISVGNLIHSTISTLGDTNMGIGAGILNSRIHVSQGDLVVSGGSSQVNAGSKIVVSDELRLGVDSMHGVLQANELELFVHNDVGKTATIQANKILPVGGTDGFRVGGDFDGKLSVAQSFDAGVGASAELVGGTVGKHAKFNVGRELGMGASASEFVFAGPFLGEFILGGDLIVDLMFGGDTSRINIAGSVLANIVVDGELDYLTTGNTFDPLTGSLFGGRGEFTGMVTADSVNNAMPERITLEPTAVPIAVLDLSPDATNPNNLVFNDSEADIIRIQLAGTAGTVTITSDESVNANGLLDNGERIVAIDITGASSDFVMTFLVNSTTNSALADGIVDMGEITSDRVIRGIYTVADTGGGGGGVPISDFRLTSFSGPGFSHAGGLAVDAILGNVAGEALTLMQSVRESRVINAQTIFGDVTMGPGTFAGTMNVSAFVLSGHWLFEGAVSSTGLLTVFDDFFADVTVNGSFDGLTTIANNVDGTWEILGSVRGSAGLLANEWDQIIVDGMFMGNLANTDRTVLSDGFDLDVNGSIGPAASIMSTHEIIFDVGGNVCIGAMVTAGEDLFATTGGTHAGVYLANDVMQLTVSGKVLNAEARAGDLAVVGQGPVVNSRMAGGNGAFVNVVKNISGSVVFGGTDVSITTLGPVSHSAVSAANEMFADVGGKVIGSTLSGSFGFVTALIDGDLLKSRISAGSFSTIVNVGGKMADSTISVLEDGLALTVGGSMSRSFVVADEEVSVTIGAGMTESSIEGSRMSLVDVGGDMKRSQVVINQMSMPAFLDLQVGGHMADSRAVANSDGFIQATIGGNLLRSDVVAGNDVFFTNVGQINSSTAISSGGPGISVAESIVGSTFIGTGGGVGGLSLGSIRDSYFLASFGGAVITTGQDYINTTTVTRSGFEVMPAGDFSGVAMAFNVGASPSRVLADGVIKSSSFVSNTEDVLIVTEALLGTVQGRQLDVRTSLDFGKDAAILAGNISNGDGDPVNFQIGGDFSGRMSVSGSFQSGAGASQLLVGGSVKSTGKFHVIGDFADIGSADEYVFAGAMLGELSIGDDLFTELNFGGNVANIMIGGNVFENIVVNGALTSLTTGSLFVPASGLVGTFFDGAGNSTAGLLTTGGFGNVSPE